MRRVLHITSELNGGGIERLLFNYYSRLSSEIVFDFAITSEEEGILVQPLLALGCRIFHLPKLRDGLSNYAKSLSIILEENQYDIVHVHSAYKAFWTLRVAKKCGVKVRIAHSHIANAPESLLESLSRHFFAFATRYYATDLFACGMLAGEWVWGRKRIRNHGVYVMKNSIDTEKYKYSESKRFQIRQQLEVDDYLVIGCVARFSYQKNHEFLIRVFSRIVSEGMKTKLLLVGDGELEETIKEQVKNYKIEESVMFLGSRDDVNDLMNAMDVFVLPSRFEGLPVTLIETQTNGLYSIVSDRITQEMSLTDIIRYVPLIEKDWVNELKIQCVSLDRLKYSRVISNSDYNIRNSAIKLLEKYEQLICERQ